MRLCIPSRYARHRAAPRHAWCTPRLWHNRAVSPVSLSASLRWPPTARLQVYVGARGAAPRRARAAAAAAATVATADARARNVGGTPGRRLRRRRRATPRLATGGDAAGEAPPCPPTPHPPSLGVGPRSWWAPPRPAFPLQTLKRRSADPATGRGRHTVGTAASRRCRHLCRHCSREQHHREQHRRHRQSTTPTAVGPHHGCTDSTRTLNARFRRHRHNNHRHTTATATAIGTTTAATTAHPPPPNPRHRPSSPPQPPTTTIRSSVTTPSRAR